MKTRLLIPAALLASLAVSRAASIFTAGHGDIGIAYEAGVQECRSPTSTFMMVQSWMELP